MNMKATVPNYGELCFDHKMITNIFSLSEMEKKFRVTYDSSTEPSFIVYLPKKQIKFIKNFSGLFYYKAKYNTNNSKETSLANHSVKSVEENILLHTNHDMVSPSLKNFKSSITSNMLKNIPITIDAINIAEKIFGLDVGALKGKTMRQKPAPVVFD
jgi:hypothetical protein